MERWLISPPQRWEGLVTDPQGKVADLPEALASLHALVGAPSDRQLEVYASLAGHRLARATANTVRHGRSKPRWETVEAFIAACLTFAQRRKPPVKVPAEYSEVRLWRVRYDYFTGVAAPVHKAHASYRVPSSTQVLRTIPVFAAAQHVFISYVREDSANADKLAEELRHAGVQVWLDRTDLNVGDRWKDSIRAAIRDGDYFIACFSPAYASRERTYMNEELAIAIDELRLRPRDRSWFLPITLGSAEVPAYPIGAGETLQDLHHIDLSSNWEDGLARLMRVIVAN